MNIVFFGSPSSVVNILEFLKLESNKNNEHKLLAVVSQPARPFGRSKKLQDPPVADYCKKNALPIYQFENVNAPDSLEILRDFQADLFITAAYGQILSDAFLAIPKRATINIHPSLIPKYRGATPVASALLDGLTKTGVTILFTVKKLDAGNIITQSEVSVPKDVRCDQLTKQLFDAAIPALTIAFEKLKDAHFKGEPQDEAAVSHCRKIQKHQGNILWSDGSEQIYRQFRAFYPWPGSYTYFSGTRISIDDLAPCLNMNLAKTLEVPIKIDDKVALPGHFYFNKEAKSISVTTGKGTIFIKSLKPEGGKVMDASSFWNGLKNREYLVFGEPKETHE